MLVHPNWGRPPGMRQGGTGCGLSGAIIASSVELQKAVVRLLLSSPRRKESCLERALHRGRRAGALTTNAYAQVTSVSILSRALSLPKRSREAAYRRMCLAHAQSAHHLPPILHAARFDTACGLLSMLLVLTPTSCPPGSSGRRPQRTACCAVRHAEWLQWIGAWAILGSWPRGETWIRPVMAQAASNAGVLNGAGLKERHLGFLPGL